MAIRSQVKDVTLEYEAASGGTLIVSINPNGSFSTSSFPIPPSAVRATRTIALDGAGPLEGSLLRLKITSTGAFKLYGGFVKVRVIGTFFDGAAGEVYETQEISLGG